MLINILRGEGEISEKLIMLFAYLGAILLAIIMHETAHGYIAMKNGDYTAKFCGRLSLNPVKHFDPIGFLMLAFVGFGWAKPVPIDPNNFRSSKKGMITVSIAGVVTNLILATVSAILLALFLLLVKAIAATVATSLFLRYFVILVEYFFLYSIIINLTLMAFNILPIYPLDGFRIVETLTKPNNKYVTFMRRYGVMVLFGLLILGNLLSYISPYFDILGLYINAVTSGFIKLFSVIFGLPL